MGKIRRLSDVGIYHIYIRGNSKNIIFYDDQDRIQFCKRLEKYSTIMGVKLYAYVLMDNHFHLLIRVNPLNPNALSNFISSVMKSFISWYNRKYELSDRLCQSPFNSAPKNSIEMVKSSLIYILQNPVKANICSTPFDYKWSSAKSYFSPRTTTQHLIIPSSFIDVDTAFVESLFDSKNDFQEMVLSKEVNDSDIREKEDVWVRVSNSELCNKLSKLLNGRLLSSLSKQELRNVSSTLSNTTNASYSQIASLLRVSKDFVRRSRFCSCGHTPVSHSEKG